MNRGVSRVSQRFTTALLRQERPPRQLQSVQRVQRAWEVIAHGWARIGADSGNDRAASGTATLKSSYARSSSRRTHRLLPHSTLENHVTFCEQMA
jgi:hypothetical protein